MKNIKKYKNSLKKLLFSLLIISSFNCYSQDGSLDLTFNSLNQLSSNNDFFSPDGNINAFSRQSNGKIIIGGNFTSINSVNINRIARLNNDGTLDSSFNIGTGINGGSVEKLVVLNNDKIIVVGNFNSYNNVTTNKILRLNSDGTLDTTFNSGIGIDVNGFIRCLKINSNNQIVIGGSFSSYNNISTSNIAIINQDGTLDTTFNIGITLGSIFSMELQTDNKIIAHYKLSVIGSTSSTITSYLKRFNTNGSLDSTFSVNNTIFLTSTSTGTFTPVGIRTIYDIKQIISGQILISGDFNTVYGQTSGGIARLNSNGTVDTSFNNGGSGIASSTATIFHGTYSIYSIDIQSDNKIIIGGNFPSYNSVNRNCIARLLQNGSLDTSFNPSTGVPFQNNNRIKQLKIFPDKRILLAGSFDSYNTVTRKSIARLNGPDPIYPIIANPDSATTIGGTSTIPIANVRANDTYNGVVATSSNTTLSFVSSTNTGVTLNTTTGAVSVSATVTAGTYTLIYQICATASPTNCVTGTVTITVSAPSLVANPDTASTSFGVASIPIGNVRTNDTYNGTVATSSNTTLSFVSTTNTGVSLNTTTGAINVSATVPAGTYTLIYKICATASSTTCINGTVTITVTAPIVNINAIDDYAYATNGVSSTAVLNVRANDTYNSTQATSVNTTLTFISSTNAGITLNTSTGVVTVSSSVPVGMHTLVYKLCSGTTCDIATVNITVYPPSTTLVNGVRANNSVQQIGLQSNGKIIISGGFTSYNNITANYFTRLNSNLTLDTTFLANGAQMPYSPFFLIQPDDKIVLVFRGNVNTYNGMSIPNGIVRLNANGSVDTTFNVGGTGIAINDELTACAMQSDGKILIGGKYLTSYNGQLVKNLIRLNTNGTIDNTFDFAYSYNTNTFACGTISKIVVQPDNKIIVGGNGNYGTNGQPNIVRLDTNGSIDTTFTYGLTGYGPSVYSAICTSCLSGIQDIELLPSGKVIVAGAFSSYNNSASIKNIVRLNSNGTVDTSFNSGTSTDRVIKDVSIDPISGKIYIGGEFTTFNTSSVKKIIRLNNDGSNDNTFNTGTATADTRYSSNPFLYNNIQSTKLQSDGKLLIGGNFTSYNGISATNITRLLPAVVGGQGRSIYENWTSEPEIDDSKSLNFENNTVKLFPNPSNGVFNISLDNYDNQNSSIEVFNILGERIHFSKINSQNSQIDLSNFSSGYYMGVVKNGDSLFKIKLIKQ